MPLACLGLVQYDQVHWFLPGVVFRHVPDCADFPAAANVVARCVPKMHMPDAISDAYVAFRTDSNVWESARNSGASLDATLAALIPDWKARLLPPSVCLHAMVHLFLPEYLRFLEEDKSRLPNQSFCRTHLRWRFGVTPFDPIGMTLSEEVLLFFRTLWDIFSPSNQIRQHLHEYSCLYEFARMPYALQAHCEKTGQPPDPSEMISPTAILVLAFIELTIFNVMNNVKSLLGAMKLRKRWY